MTGILGIRYLDGPRLRRAAVAGARRLIASRVEIDRINVFPVADADTGSNLAATVRGLIDDLETAPEKGVSAIADRMALAGLMAACGNSGNILAQLFEGFAEGLRGLDRADAQAVAEAAELAAQRATEALAVPTEGTILTVARAWALALRAATAENPDLELAFEVAHVAAAEAVESTTKELEVLREADVVDAGALGFLRLLDGVRSLLRDGSLRDLATTEAPAEDDDRAEPLHVTKENPTFRFCSEAVVSGVPEDPMELRERLSPLGDSLLVAGSPRRRRFHIHTNDPRAFFDTAHSLGEVLDEKVDDIWEQTDDAHGDFERRVAVVTDSTCDLPVEVLRERRIRIVPVRIHIGDRDFVDKVSITRANFLDTLAAFDEHPKTSTPTTRDFHATYERLAKHYPDGVVAFHLAGRLTSTVRLAESVAEKISDQITVLDGRSASVGLGLIALEAIDAVEAGGDHAAVAARTRWAIEHTRVFFSVASTEYMIRGGRISTLKGWFTRLVGLKPILTFDPEGQLAPIGAALGRQNVAQKTLDVVADRVGSRKGLRFAVCHAEAPDIARWYADEIRARFDPEFVIETEISPALSCHTGPGSAGIGFVDDPGAAP